MDLTEKYLLDLCYQELITVDEEIELAQKTRKGEIEARNRLVSANMRFVVSLAKQYLYKGLEFEDLLQEGFLGLIKAAERFDETRGFKFISYFNTLYKLHSSINQIPNQDTFGHKVIKNSKS